jgi:hypothetical protein
MIGNAVRLCIAGVLLTVAPIDVGARKAPAPSKPTVTLTAHDGNS